MFLQPARERFVVVPLPEDALMEPYRQGGRSALYELRWRGDKKAPEEACES